MVPYQCDGRGQAPTCPGAPEEVIPVSCRPRRAAEWVVRRPCLAAHSRLTTTVKNDDHRRAGVPAAGSKAYWGILGQEILAVAGYPPLKSHAGPGASPEGKRALDLSIVVPVFNECESLDPLYEALAEALLPWGDRCEILFVDDGSSDGSLEVLRRLAARDCRVHVLEFARNFGQTAALSAGFRHAVGAIVVPLDADLQNDPADIPRIVEKVHEGYDVVCCWRRDRKDAWLTRILPSRMANHLISRVSGVHLKDYGCTLKGYRREVLEHVRLYGEMHRFIPILATWAGARVVEMPVQHHPRRHGESKYGMQRTIKVLLDLTTVKFLGSYSTKPMYPFGGLGLAAFATGTLLSLFTLYQKFFYEVKAHRNPLLLLAIFCFLSGLQFILFGLVAELIVRTYHESQDKEIYILKTPRRGRDE
ncbi:glycosyltransferase family 2 protein [bacterium]|nr:glycosyltransferase family 2 protein [bacterium]